MIQMDISSIEKVKMSSVVAMIARVTTIQVKVTNMSLIHITMITTVMMMTI